jgi:ADP-ribose pyrophosphatase YjhB (NUDIX family)
LRFCPKCGGSLELRLVANDHKPRHVCQQCRFVFYQDPKVSACTIPVLAEKVAMVQRAISPGRGLWVFPGGYMDQDETVEEAAIRETLEEVNLRVRLTGLVGIYSYRTPVVVVVYAAAVLGGEMAIDRESLDARWFSEAEIPWEQLAFPSTQDALRDFFRSRNGQ